jgi:hypothetical protein
MGKENEIIRPQSRLDANTVAKSRAIDAQRGAVNAERQGMQNERALQRQYRRAVRRNDIGQAAAINDLLTKTGGSIVGPVIRKAEEERMVAGQRAIDRADQQNKIRAGGIPPIEGEQDNPPPKVDQGGADDIEGKTANSRSKPGAGKGRPAKGGGDRTVGDRNEEADGIEQQAAPPPAQGSKVASGEKNKPTQQPDDSFESFANDLKRSKLVASGDSGAIERAVARGEDLGATREQTLYEIENNKGTSIPTLASLPPDEPKIKPSNKLKEIGDILDSVKFSEPSIFGPKGTDKQTPDFVRVPIPSRPAKPSNKELNLAQLEQTKIQADADYWNVDPNKFLFNGSGKQRFGIESDPRYAAMKIKKMAFERAWLKEGKILPFGANKDAPKKQEALAKKLMIEMAIAEGQDISGFTKQDPAFNMAYLNAKKENSATLDEINSANNEISSLESETKAVLSN